MNDYDPCTCGAMYLDIPPDNYRLTAALVAAYFHGESEAFAALLDEAPKDALKPMTVALFAAVHLVAEARGMTPLESLQAFCRSAERMATDAE